jgi:hypothetical protein
MHLLYNSFYINEEKIVISNNTVFAAQRFEVNSSVSKASGNGLDSLSTSAI